MSTGLVGRRVRRIHMRIIMYFVYDTHTHRNIYYKIHIDTCSWRVCSTARVMRDFQFMTAKPLSLNFARRSIRLVLILRITCESAREHSQKNFQKDENTSDDV